MNLPGSPKGAKENFDFIKKPLIHAIDVLKDTKSKVESLHRSMQSPISLKVIIKHILQSIPHIRLSACMMQNNLV